MFDYNGQTWNRATVRKMHRCCLCAKAIYTGDDAYRPANASGGNLQRAERICQHCALTVKRNTSHVD